MLGAIFIPKIKTQIKILPHSTKDRKAKYPNLLSFLVCINICSACNRTLYNTFNTSPINSNGLYLNLNRCPYKRQVCSYKADFQRRVKNDKGKRNGNQKTQENRRQKGRTQCRICNGFSRIIRLCNDRIKVICIPVIIKADQKERSKGKCVDGKSKSGT